MEPPSFDEEWTNAWSVWALDHGLPDLPDGLTRGESVPIARWVGGEIGAVLHVQRSWSPEDPEHDSVVSEVEVFRRAADRWESFPGGGGGGWSDPPFTRDNVRPTEAHIEGMHHAVAINWHGCAFYGVAGSKAESIELRSSGESFVMPLESSFGAFVVACDGDNSATISIRDRSGSVLMSKEYEGHPFGRRKVEP